MSQEKIREEKNEMTLKEKAKLFYEYAFTIVWVDFAFGTSKEPYTKVRHNRRFIEAERPNQDTLYSFMPMQLEHTPYILEIPAGYEDYTAVRSEDSQNYFIIRTEAYGEADYPKANAIQDRFIAKPLYPDRIVPRGSSKANGSLSVSYIENMDPETFIGIFIGTLEDTVHDEKMIG